MYALLFRTVLSRLDAERAHRVGFGLIRLAGAVPGVRALLARLLAPPADLRISLWGKDFAGPLGLAAGFDKDAVAPDLLAALGFGFVEVGTLTARPQPGNPRPRLFRLPADRALVNRMGFNNAGSAAAAARLAGRRRPGRAVVGANIGRSRVVDAEHAVEDYLASARRLAPVADYLVVNVSSPNTPGLRDLQATGSLRPLLTAVREVAGGVPLLVKIAPDLAEADLDEIADLARELGLAGIVATNTTTGRGGLRTAADTVAALGAGGLSGPPLADRSLAVLRRLRARVGDDVVLVAAGGIETADQAWARLRAGATLVQAYTAFVYHGPFWAARLQRDLARLIRADAQGRPPAQ